MIARALVPIGILVALAAPVLFVLFVAPRLSSRTLPEPDLIPASQRHLAPTHRRQLEMLAKHRPLFEAAARDEPGKRDELRNGIAVWCYQGGASYCIRWNDGQGAHFSTWFGLYYCPNGERDLPERFWDNPFLYKDPVKIDDHWFAAKEPGG